MTGIHGSLLVLTGILHVLFGLSKAVYGQEWSNFWNKGFFRAVWIDNDRNMAAFWFVVSGGLMSLGGLALYSLETADVVSPAFGWTLLVIAVLGSVMTPKSGFTFLLLPQAIFYLLMH